MSFDFTNFMPYRRPTWMLAFPALLSAGCALRGNVDALESELRQQEYAQQALGEELKAAREELRVARSDADDLRARMAQRGTFALASEQAEVLYRAEGIKFNMMLTSGVDRDGQPGDDGLSVLLLPVDGHGDLVKLVGAVELELLDLTRDGDDKRIDAWQFTVDEVRDHWHRGFLSAGYLFQLDWQTVPVTPQLTLHAKLTAPDGRKFDATTQLKVELPGSTPQPIAQARYTTSRASDKAPQAAISPEAQRKPQTGPLAPPQIVPNAKAADRPGHAALQTSDNWTEQTIPRLR
jgi:outer membrane murein-binding lipoprotein Lpp